MSRKRFSPIVTLGIVTLILVTGVGAYFVRELTRSRETPAIISSMGHAATNGPLRVDPKNPRYFEDASGRAVYLTGSHNWASLKDRGKSNPPRAFDWSGYLSFLESHGHNFMRMWTSDLLKSNCGSGTTYVWPFPWVRSGPGTAVDGGLKFDLNKLDQAYFDRLRDRVIQARDRGIYVSIMLFEGYGPQFCEDSLGGSPFDGRNNINGITVAPTAPYTLNAGGKVLAIQEAYVTKVIDTVNNLDNVLYEISNEAGAYSTTWQEHMIDFVHAQEAQRPKQHPVGMTFQFSGGSNSTLFASRAEWISPNPEAPPPYDYESNPPPADGRKVVLSDTDHLWGVGGDRDWVWKSFTRGLNVLYMDPLKRDATMEQVRVAMGQTRYYASKLNLAAMVPHGDLTSTSYALANPGQAYLIYAPSKGSFSANLSNAAPSDSFSVQWFNPATNSTINGGTVSGGAAVTLAPPFSGAAVVYLLKQSVPPASGTGPSKLGSLVSFPGAYVGSVRMRDTQRR